MNERIFQLVGQAISEVPFPMDFNKEHAVFAEKFAELIVEECGEIAYKAYWDNPETVRGIHIKEKIKEHFGVK